MSTVAVVAHASKRMGGGLRELREVLAGQGVGEPLWYEVNKSRKAPQYASRAVAQGADLIFVWGGDGMVQRCIDAVAGIDATLAILPAGTANLLATNLNIPHDLTAAVMVGLHGARRELDTGTINGEHFAVMAGTGFDAQMIKGASRRMKRRLGRMAYVYTGTKNLSARGMKAHVKVDGQQFHKGRISCVLVGTVGKLFGGIEVFGAARPDDGVIEVGLVTADNPAQWARTFGRLAAGSPERSPFVKVTRGRKVRIKLNKKVPYELDGGDRKKTKKLRIKVHPASVTICVPLRSETDVTPLPASDVLATPAGHRPHQPAPAGP
ncbi:MAG: diacylglycerol/lipid kinase family protein [Streptosporangiaceae bacterium]